MFSVKPFNSILDLLKVFPDEQTCINHLEELIWEGNVVSPFDETSKVYKCSNNRYKCRNTNKYFNVRTNTIFEGTKIPLQHWFVGIYLFTVTKKGISSYELATELGITQKTSWFMLQRIRYAMEHKTFLKEMEGVIEVDETFVGGKNKNRHWDKKVKNSQGRSFKDKTPVLGMLNQDGHLRCEVIADTTASEIQPILISNIKLDSIVVTDEWKAYNRIDSYFDHQIVDHKRKQYVNQCGFTTNSIEGFWSEFKKGLIGTHHNVVSRKHLQKYANEFTFRYNLRKVSVKERFNHLLEGAKGKRLTYKALTSE